VTPVRLFAFEVGVAAAHGLRVGAVEFVAARQVAKNEAGHDGSPARVEGQRARFCVALVRSSCTRHAIYSETACGWDQAGIDRMTEPAN
jgi:hypothetical protein